MAVYCCWKLCKGATLLTSVCISSPPPLPRAEHISLTQHGIKGKAQKGRVTGPKAAQRVTKGTKEVALELSLDTCVLPAPLSTALGSFQQLEHCGGVQTPGSPQQEQDGGWSSWGSSHQQ